VQAKGHAIEARIYAEDPEREFSLDGRLVHVEFPSNARVDTGVEPGAEISPWYDPMLPRSSCMAMTERLRWPS